MDLTAAQQIGMAARLIDRDIARKNSGFDPARGSSTRPGVPGRVFLHEVARVAGVSKEAILAEGLAGRIEIARCDLPQAFDSAAVAASDVHHVNATFNFVVLA